MQIDPAPARRLFPRMRFCLVIFLLAIPARTAMADVPVALASALKAFRADAPRGWSYTQTTSALGKSTVEHSDAAKPEFGRWSLLQKDDRPPTVDDTREYFEARSRRSRGGTAPKLVEQLDLTSVEQTGDDAGRITFRCRLKSGEGGDRTANFLRATLVVHQPTATLELIELHSIEPFRPAFGVTIREMQTRMIYSLPAGDTPSLPQRVETRVRGTAFWFKSLDADMTVIFSDYTRTAKR